MSVSPANYNSDILIQTPYYQEGFVTINFQWGSYAGTLKYNKGDGFGIQTMTRSLPGSLPSEHNSATYRGDWKNGQRNGYGRLELPWNDTAYEGGWMNGKGCGFGKLITMRKGLADEWEECGFKEGQAHGWGVTRIAGSKDTAWYSGGYRKGLRHGYYVKYTGTVAQYMSVKNGVPHGYQTTKRDGSVQGREFMLDGKAMAQPTVNFAPDWLDLRSFNPHGARYPEGTHSFNASADLANGDRYTGNLHYGMPHGYGIITCSASHRRPGVYEGGWKYGYACGYGIWTGMDGNKYEGGWHNGKPFGYGIVTAGGQTFDTFWEDGKGWRFMTSWGKPYPDYPDQGGFRMPSPPKPSRTFFI